MHRRVPVSRDSLIQAGWLGIVVFLLTVNPALAQRPPQLGYVFPPVIRAGAATNVQLGGFDFTSDMQFFVHDPRVKLNTSGIPGDYLLTPPPYWMGSRAAVTAMPIPREIPATLETDPAMPPGPIFWQVASANGTSQTAVFYVSNIPEIVESRSRALPQRLPELPVGVSGRLSRLAEVDRYSIVADADGLISVELTARGLGADFNGMLQVHDAHGILLAELADTQGLDGGLTFAARSGETYAVSLFDADFRGDPSYVYHLAVTRGPRIVCTLPAAGQRGSTREVEFVGYGISSGQAVLESVRQVVSFPADPSLSQFIHVLKTPHGRVEVPIPLSDLEESGPGSAPSQLPSFATTDRLPEGTDQRLYTFSSQKDESWRIDVESRAIGGRLDVSLAVFDSEGKEVADSDDLAATSDTRLEFRAPAAGILTCIVKSETIRANLLDEVYRLSVRKADPDFALSMPLMINVPLGGKITETVQVVRSGGFDGEIVLSVEGLPAGVTLVGDAKIPAGSNELKMTLEAAPAAAVVASPLRIMGTATISQQTASRTATAVANGILSPRSPAQQLCQTALLAVTMPPPFEIHLIDRTRQREVARGTACLADMQIVRKNGFAGEIVIEMASKQSRYLCGSRGMNVRVLPGESRAIYPALMTEWLSTDLTMRMATQGVAAVNDPQGNPRFLVMPTDAPITMIMEGALLKISSSANTPTLSMGRSCEIPVHITRSPKLSLATTVSLVVPDEIKGLLTAEPIILPLGEDQGILKISCAADERLLGEWALRLNATAMQEGKWPVVSEVDLPVVIERSE